MGGVCPRGNGWGLPTGREGVEDAHALTGVESLGGVAAQGFSFSRPWPPAAFLSGVDRHAAGEGDALRPHAVV